MPSGYIDFENNRAVIAALKRDGEVAFDAVYRHYYRGALCVLLAICGRIRRSGRNCSGHDALALGKQKYSDGRTELQDVDVYHRKE